MVAKTIPDVEHLSACLVLHGEMPNSERCFRLIVSMDTHLYKGTVLNQNWSHRSFQVCP